MILHSFILEKRIPNFLRIDTEKNKPPFSKFKRVGGGIIFIFNKKKGDKKKYNYTLLVLVLCFLNVYIRKVKV